MEYLDAFVDALRAEVGPHPEAEETLRYYVLDAEDWAVFDDEVGCRGAACTTAFRTVYARGFLPSTHEVVHAELFTDGHRFLEEGLAMVYGEHLFPNRPAHYDVRKGLSEDWVAGEAYSRAGHFAAFVIERHGIERFMAVKDASTSGSSFDELSALFGHLTGEPFEDLLAAYDQIESECRPPGFHAMLVECDQPATPWSGEGPIQRIAFDFDFSCSDGNVMGPYEDIFLTRAFEVEASSEVWVTVDGAGVEVHVSRCDGSCVDLDATGTVQDTFFVVPEGRSKAFSAQPGRYSVRVSKRAAFEADIIPVVDPGVVHARVWISRVAQ